MRKIKIPFLSTDETVSGIKQANDSDRKRFAKILHTSGAEFNEVFNFINHDSYMQPHLHPGVEKIEYIHLIEGRVAILFFDDKGIINNCTILEKNGTASIKVPAFTWHTYIMLTEHVITYETMMGIYQPETWKKFAGWAPREDTLESIDYLALLRRQAIAWLA
jgi:cupin fold WbuC family metalloprotein